MATDKNLKSALCASFIKMVAESATRMENKKPKTFNSQEYSDRVALMLFAQDQVGKPSYFAATSLEPRLACSAFHSDMDAFVEEMSQQNNKHNWNGMYGPKTIISDSLASLTSVAGAKYKNILAEWVDAQAEETAPRQLAQA